jgi:hypothetical protein
MYELDRGIDLSFLVGLTLTQVGVGEFQIQLCFHENVTISIEESVECTTATSVSRWGYNDRWTSSPEGDDMKAVTSLLSLLGKTTTAFRRVGKSGLALSFEGNSSLEVFGENTNYESFQINHPGGMIVV